MGYLLKNLMFQEYFYAKDEWGCGLGRYVHTLISGDRPGRGSQMYWLIVPVTQRCSQGPIVQEAKHGVLDGCSKAIFSQMSKL